MATDIATCMYYTGIDPFTKQEVHVARHPRDRTLLGPERVSKNRRGYQPNRKTAKRQDRR